MQDNMRMSESVERMAREIAAGCGGRLHGFWLYGSVVLNDFRLGWSDIDFLALTDAPITEEQAERLVPLRQTLSEAFPDNPLYRCFEGVIANLEEYRAGAYTRLVYWGTSGQRVTNRYAPDVFSRYELAKYGKLVCGKDEPGLFTIPKRQELTDAIRRHYDAIRKYAAQTDESLYSCGWLLDLARCVYTLRNGDVIAKTRAGEWALRERIFPDEDALRRTLTIRRDPLAYRDCEDTKLWLRELGPTVQRCADVLEAELVRCG